MDTTLLASILLFISILFIALLVLFIKIYVLYQQNIKTMMLATEAIDKLTQAQKSCLLYLQKIQKELDTYDGK